MTSEKKPAPPTTANIFANALASTPKYVDAGVSAGMHNTLTCTNCGAAREKPLPAPAGAAIEKLLCRYCNAPLSAKAQ